MMMMMMMLLLLLFLLLLFFFFTSWWFQPLSKILVKLDHSPGRDQNKKHLKPPPSAWVRRLRDTLIVHRCVDAVDRGKHKSWQMA